MNSIQTSFFKSALVSGNKILQGKTKFEKFYSELVEFKAELNVLNGYENVLEVLDGYVKFFALVQEIMQIYKNFI